MAGSLFLPGAAFASPCEFVYQAYGHAILVNNQRAVESLSSYYVQCLLEEGRPTDVGAVRTYLQQLNALGQRVKFETYGGRVKAQGIVVEAVQALLGHLGTAGDGVAKQVFLTSLVRDRADQERLLRDPVLKHEAVRQSLHLAGAAADIAFSGRTVTMPEAGRRARQVLLDQLGVRAQLLDVRVEPYCLHVQIARATAGGELDRIFAGLTTSGVLQSTVPRGSIPSVESYIRPPAMGRSRR
jgi:hypothetical protein